MSVQYAIIVFYQLFDLFLPLLLKSFITAEGIRVTDMKHHSYNAAD